MAKATTAKRATKKTQMTSSEPVVKMTIPTEKAGRPSMPIKAATKPMPSYEQIAAKAYEIWAAKGYPGEQDAENWRQAEIELCGGCKLTNAA
ncbi:MAG: DUF2934 domain-containing protein [Phycisphaeraceae bacterium]